MCEFVSWIEVERGGEKNVLYLDDKELFSERSQEILKGSKDNDFLGHHAIRNVWTLKEDEGKEGENKDFWNGKLPGELKTKLKDFDSFKRNFGKMFSEYAQPNDLRHIIQNAPKTKKWSGLKEFCEERLMARLEKRVREIVKMVKLEKLKITARHSQSIKDLAKAAKLDYADSDINDQHFPEDRQKDEKNEAVLVHINQVVSTEEAEAVIKHLKLRSGGVKELLSLSIDHPEKQREFPIAELRSSWQSPGGGRDVASLGVWGGGRELFLLWRVDVWSGFCRFLAFSEV